MPEDLRKSDTKNDQTTWEKIQIPYDPDCLSCKIVGMVTLYGAGALVLSYVPRVPKTNPAGKVAMAAFGISLFGVGTMRFFVK
ncbi:uncharacterized protein LOC116605482 [Nematostella vectensis]|uniref:uncharacterized protein LOC116605482 n=1 Tax=Nematostella vectensis TaxID=45351 RepID=UPI00207755FA|nr:uncharacterized protein LOC116605482 [Nematostella vectensis]